MLMYEHLYETAVLALATAAISCTISRAKVFEPVRSWIKERNEWLGTLASCSYCTSHWVALGWTALARPYVIDVWTPAAFFATMFTMVAISAVVGGVITLLTFNGDSNFDIKAALMKAREVLEREDN